MAKTAIILGKSAAVVATIADMPIVEPARGIANAGLAQRRVVRASNAPHRNLGASQFKAAGFTESEIEEIAFVLLGSLRASHDA